MSESKGKKMYGGLIKPRSKETTTKEGHKVTEHWDGRQDVQINATPVNSRTVVQPPGE